MKKKEIKKEKPSTQDKSDPSVDFSYPGSEDIYARATEDQDIDPEDISKTKTPNQEDQSLDRGEVGFDDMITGRTISERQEASDLNEKDFDSHMSGRDLDVPGSELDDALEDNGDEDEENNSYSIGGDRHDALDEDHG
jgi:hypothetical protein